MRRTSSQVACLWNECTSVEEFLTRSGYQEKSLHTVACRLRKKGFSLKTLPRERTANKRQIKMRLARINEQIKELTRCRSFLARLLHEEKDRQQPRPVSVYGQAKERAGPKPMSRLRLLVAANPNATRDELVALAKQQGYADWQLARILG